LSWSVGRAGLTVVFFCTSFVLYERASAHEAPGRLEARLRYQVPAGRLTLRPISTVSTPVMPSPARSRVMNR
jgi:hypothetical protein